MASYKTIETHTLFETLRMVKTRFGTVIVDARRQWDGYGAVVYELDRQEVAR